MAESRLWQQLDRFGKMHPRTPAVRSSEGKAASLTWGQWRSAAAALAEALRGAAIPTGRVMLALSNQPAYHVAFAGVLLADRDVLPVSPESTEAELVHLIAAGDVGVLIGESEVLERLRHLAVKRWSAPDPDWLISDGIERAFDWHQGYGALVLATSGTTGKPKLVSRSSASLDAVAANCVEAIGLTETDRVLMPVPVHHSYGLEHGLLAPLLAGASVDLAQCFDTRHLCDCLGYKPITALPAVPSVFESLPEAMARSNLSRHGLFLRRAYSAGGPLPPRVAKACRSALGIGVGQVYGSTEIGSVTFNDPNITPFDPISVGRPMRDVKLRLITPGASETGEPQPVDVEGEVAVHAPSMLDYYINSDSSPTAAGFFPTGDLGRISNSGQLTITGRVKLLIDVGGNKVNPLEVESVLVRHPAVREAVVVATPVTDTINRLKAIVIPDGAQPPDTNTLRRFVRQTLSAHKVPRLIELHEELPRTAAGKIQRSALESS